MFLTTNKSIYKNHNNRFKTQTSKCYIFFLFQFDFNHFLLLTFLNFIYLLLTSIMHIQQLSLNDKTRLFGPQIFYIIMYTNSMPFKV